MDWISPMEPISSQSLVTGEQWIHQIKWDGIRGMIYVHQNSFKIFTKRGRERTDFYPELDCVTEATGRKQAVLDGEIVALGEENRPTFQWSLVRERVSNPARVSYYAQKYPIVYVVFDILYLNESSLLSRPFAERQQILRDILKTGPSIAMTDSFKDGKALFELMKAKSWEGIVTKRLDSPYISGKNHRMWYKTKLIKKVLAIVCGIQWKEGFPISLLLGNYQTERLSYIGKASLGLTQQDLMNLKAYAADLTMEESPFDDPGPGPRGSSVTWLKPVMTCWVSFFEWTSDGILRHPKILGFTGLKAHEADGREYVSDE